MCLCVCPSVSVRAVCVRLRVSDEWRTPLEEEVMGDAPLTDLDGVASPATSLLELSPRPRGGRVEVGDTLRVRVTARDPRGRLVPRGGHHVKVSRWRARRQGQSC